MTKLFDFAPSEDPGQPEHPPRLSDKPLLRDKTVAYDPNIFHAHSKDSYQTGHMPNFLSVRVGYKVKLS